MVLTGRSMPAAADAGLHGEPDVAGEVADESGGAPDAVGSELRARA
ncbi:hypothetical protein ACI79G_13095 [Geodermatophilus sp. SYSU D00779]